MPTYQYRCTACGDDLEVVQNFSDAALTECPVCGGRLRKVFGSVGLVFKGSGFYKTDSRSGSSSTSAPAQRSKEGAADSSPADSSSKDSVKADSSGSSTTAGSTSASTSSTASSTAA